MTEIKNNTFIGVNWDETSNAAVRDVARALLNLTELFISQNIHIDSLLKISSDEEVIEPLNKK